MHVMAMTTMAIASVLNSQGVAVQVSEDVEVAAVEGTGDHLPDDHNSECLLLVGICLTSCINS